VHVEADKDLEEIVALNSLKLQKAGDFDKDLIDKRAFMDPEEELAQQIKDLNDL